MIDKIILIIKYIVVALVQGIGEILPISSSGHMVIIQSILGLKSEDLTFEIFLHFASLIAIILFFYKKIWLMIKSFIQYIFKKELRKNEEVKHNFKLCIYLVIATIPVGIIGVLLDDYIGAYLSKMWIVGCFLLLTSAMLFIITKLNRERKIEEMTYLDALIIGLFQCIGLFPGISRSGSCIYGASFRKLEKDTAAEYAFLLFVPAVFGATIMELSNFSKILVDDNIGRYLLSFVVTSIVTYLAFGILLKT